MYCMKRVGVFIALAFLGLIACTNNKWELIAPKSAVCDTTGIISYAKIIVPILNTNCGSGNAGCHGPGAPHADPNLSTYAGVQTVALNGQMMADIGGTGLHKMPLTGVISPCDTMILRKWIKAGSLNN